MRLKSVFGIQYIRELYKYTLKGLSEKLSEKEKISAQAISMWEQGTKAIPVKRLEHLSEIFNTPKNFFSKELSDIDKLIIDNIKLKRELSDSSYSLEYYLCDDETGEYYKAEHTHYNHILDRRIEENKLKINALTTINKIYDIIFDKSDSDKFMIKIDSKTKIFNRGEFMVQIVSRTALFNRFADIIKNDNTNFPNLLFHAILDATELAVEFSKNPQNENHFIIDNKVEETKMIYDVIRKSLIEFYK